MGDTTTTATEVRDLLDRIESGAFGDRAAEHADTIEGFAEAVVEHGRMTPDRRVTAELSLTPRERITGHREQDMTAMLSLGVMIGAALERDVPQGSETEDAWRNGAVELPDGGE